MSASPLAPGDLALLVCPRCRSSLRREGDARSGTLRCGCGAAWPIEEGLPRLYREADVRGTDRLMRLFYDALPSLHDPLTRHLLPILQVGEPEAQLRDRYMRRIELSSLGPRADGRPLRVLEVGIGAGANLPLVDRDLPPGLPVELWGLDLSEGMLRQCQRRLRRSRRRDVRLLLGDAHALPFPDGAFDRVFHVGALGSFRDPRAALAEMARVAAPGSPIVVVDEQLDPAGEHSAYHRAAFRLLTFYDAAPHCPVELLPPGATDVLEEQVSRFYYCLRFRVSARP
jgi:ubiquinone/menaquinone biosynthesis C-methylase UbiE/uncharacterized protein YbaR (Trm112 family)